MTGGLAYILRCEVEQVLNEEFVLAHELEDEEEGRLRALLETHLSQTDSPVAFRLLARKSPLPFVRIQPIHLQGTVEAAWRVVPSSEAESMPIPAPNFLEIPATPAPHYA
jgi:glutamate synthase domain-containing protein 3